MSTIAATSKPYHLTADEGLQSVWWKTGRVWVKASGVETAGRFAQIEVDDPRGAAPPMHIHHTEDETFLVLDGEVSVFAGGERTELQAGDYAFIPRGDEHAYLVQSERARMLVTFSPAGFEEFFVEMGVAGDQPPADPVMPSPEEFARRLAPYGCAITGPPPELA
ncbi:Quercetin 2,3-dioxygenase [Paraconexibacter sp. AEG42_29]|uniref:Quercetin 2,3-dioxygenase n=1 Tax=Paraconexibacter sp. AEG42_29 TaxID=2997339 RepID=A0AAU7AYS4_9ACTN